MKAMIFGTGEVGRKALPFLEKIYNILCFVDNNVIKWGTALEGYTIKSPEQIENSEGDIIIASTKYSGEIIKQLQNMNIARERIYLCRRFESDCGYEYEAYPIMEHRIEDTNKPLIQYDLYHREEGETNSKKVLIFCSEYSTYTKQLIENMSKRYAEIEISLLTNAKKSKDLIIADQLRHIYYFQTMSDLKTILKHLPTYDAMQLLWIEWIWAYFYQLIRAKTKRLNLNVGGSDFYRAGEEERDFRKRLIECADCITAETASTVEEVEEYYQKEAKNKIGLLPFGIEVLEEIEYKKSVSPYIIKNKFKIPTNKIIVTCAHNANYEHQHFKIIEALEKLSDDAKSKIICVFPMTYPKGKDTYINSVRDKLREIGLNYTILTDFMGFQEMAEYALISDIMIHVQTTDQLSSTMLEEMYAGSIVIAGKWLPYKSLHEMGIFFLDVEAIAGVTASLETVINNIEEYKKKCEKNKEIVWKHSSWDELAPRWRTLWN